MVNQTSNLDLAIKARILGYNIIPLRGGPIDSPDYKKPLINWEKYQTQLSTITEIRQWALQTEVFGIVTGPISKILVLDVDGLIGYNSLQPYTIPSTWSVKTHREHSFHKFFKWTEGLNKRKTTQTDIIPNEGEPLVSGGVDVRGDGGYVVAWNLNDIPPLSKLSEPPQWLIDKLPFKQGVPNDTTSKQNDRLAKPEGWTIEALNSLTMGNRNATFTSVAGRLWRKGLGKDEIRHFLIPFAHKVNFTLEELETILTSITRYEQNEKVEIKSFKTSLEDYKQRVKERGQFKVPELSTGYKSFDEATWGLRRGDVVTIGARTGVGKTCLCVSIASNLAKEGKRLLYISTEMTYDQVFDRFIACTAEIDAFSLSTGNLSESDKQKLHEFYQKSHTYDFNIFDGFEPNLDSVKEVIDEYKPDVVFFDHIQHIGSSGDNQVRELEKFIKGLKDIARQLNVSIVVASQLKDPPPTNFKGQVTEDRPPVLSDIKWCKAIAEESSQVLLLSRLGGDTDNPSIPVICNLIKNRHGKTSFFELSLNKRFTKFEEVL